VRTFARQIADLPNNLGGFLPFRIEHSDASTLPTNMRAIPIRLSARDGWAMGPVAPCAAAPLSLVSRRQTAKPRGDANRLRS